MATLSNTDPAFAGAFAIFCDQCHEFLGQAEHLLRQDAPSFVELGNGFHKIKGGAGFFGLDKLSQVAAAAEKTALKKSSHEIESLTGSIAELRKLFERARAELGGTNG